MHFGALVRDHLLELFTQIFAQTLGSNLHSNLRLTLDGSAFDNRSLRLHHYRDNSLARVEFLSNSGGIMFAFFRDIWSDQQGQDIAEYAVMLAVILVLVIGTVRLIGTSANNAFSQVASSLQQQ
jgi:Flp pilus assembly pilin Flp